MTSSYNGKPPSNAGQFVQWLEELKPDELKRGSIRSFLVVEIIIGLVPTNGFQDTLMSKWLKKEQQDFSKRGEADASGDFEEQLEQWKQNMWSDAMKAFGLELNKNMEKRAQYFESAICQSSWRISSCTNI